MQRSTFNRIKNIFGADNLGIQNVYTPINKIEETTDIKFFDFVTPEMKNIGVLFNWEFVYTMLEEALKNNYTNNMKFTYFYDSEADKKALTFNGFEKGRFAKVNYEIEFVNICEFTEKNKDIKVIEKAMAGKHFDIVFSNPPYNNNIDLKILQTMFNHSEVMIIIHPASWLLTKTTAFNKEKNSIGAFLETCILSWSSLMFGQTARVKNAISISVFNKSKTKNNDIHVFDKMIVNNHKEIEEYYTNIYNISWHGGRYEKILESMQYYFEYMNTHDNCMKYTVDVSEINEFSYQIGKASGDDLPQWWDIYFTIALDKQKNFRNRNSKLNAYKKFIWAFNNNNERINYDNYLKTKVIRFICSLYKANIDLSSCKIFDKIPWMDFSQEWNDKKLCEEFGIDEELWQYIDKFIPDYYEDYESGF